MTATEIKKQANVAAQTLDIVTEKNVDKYRNTPLTRHFYNKILRISQEVNSADSTRNIEFHKYFSDCVFAGINTPKLFRPKTMNDAVEFALNTFEDRLHVISQQPA